MPPARKTAAARAAHSSTSVPESFNVSKCAVKGSTLWPSSRQADALPLSYPRIKYTSQPIYAPVSDMPHHPPEQPRIKYTSQPIYAPISDMPHHPPELTAQRLAE